MQFSQYFLFLLPFLFFINLSALIYMSLDKNKAIAQEKRIKEGDLFFFAICFGSLGILIGMYLFRHKTKKLYFIIGIPLALIENIITLFYINQIFLTF